MLLFTLIVSIVTGLVFNVVPTEVAERGGYDVVLAIFRRMLDKSKSREAMESQPAA